MTIEIKKAKNTVLFNHAPKGDMHRTPQAGDKHIHITLAGQDTIHVDIDEIPHDILKIATLHGLKQKIVDSTAGKRGTEARAALEATIEMLQDNLWTRAREGGTGSNQVTLLVEALMRVFDKDKAECVNVVDSLDDNQKKEMLKQPQIAAEILTIKAERLAERQKAAKEMAKDAKESFNPFA